LIGGQLSDKASALQNMAFASGSAIAPIIGGRLADMYGFRKTCDYVGFFALLIAALNFCIVLLPTILCGTKGLKEKQKNFDAIDSHPLIMNNTNSGEIEPDKLSSNSEIEEKNEYLI